MDKILENIAIATLKHMKQSQLFPYASGQLQQLSKATVEGDTIIINFGSPYSRALAQSRKHLNFGLKLVAEQKEIIEKSLRDGAIVLLDSHLGLLEGEFQ